MSKQNPFFISRRSDFLLLIKNMYEILIPQLEMENEKHETWNKYDNSKKFSVLEKMLILRGYDCMCVASTLKREIINKFHEFIIL